MKHAVLAGLFLLFVLTGWAQGTGKISGRIRSKNATAMEGATVSLLRVKDSATLQSSVADKEGAYVFEGLPEGVYVVAATATGYRKSHSATVEITAQQPAVRLPPVFLVATSKELATVTVTAARPLIEQKIDRTVVNVEASITNTGASALEVLEKAPGVSVDRDGNISLKGKEGVLVMIDGRPTQLGGADLAALLRNMNAAQLDQIEVMTAPPARYDASGTSGIINIKTKKISTAGLNGSASASYAQGRYPKTTEGLNVNYRQRGINLFANLAHNYQKRFSTLGIDRNILSGGSAAIDKIFNQEVNRVSEGAAYNAKLGLDFFATKQTTIGAVLNLASRNLSSANANTTKIRNAARELESVTTAMVDNATDWSSVSANLNFRRLLDGKGRELTADVDYAKHTMNNGLFMVNAYTDATGNPYAKSDSLTGSLPQAINVYSARADYVHPLKNKASFEAGIKTSVVRTDNDAGYDSIQHGTIIHDLSRSNHFVYEEAINAAYVNLNTTLSEKWSAQFGLRVENTAAKGKVLTTAESFDRHYTQVFPTAYLQYKANEKNSFGANLGRRVNRPGYGALNPFIRFIDRYTFGQGNPSLKPSVSSNVELSHTWKTQVTTTINYTQVKDIVQEVIQQNGQEAYNRPANVSSLRQFGIAVTASARINKWWTGSLNINLYNDRYKGAIGNTPIDRSATGFVISGTQQFKINNTLTAEINGRFRNGSLEGVMRVQPVGVAGAGLSQQVLKNKGTIRLTARDIFWTQRLRGSTQYGNVDVEMRQVSETQVVTIGFSYGFSKGKKIAPIKRTEGSATEEQSRIGQ